MKSYVLCVFVAICFQAVSAGNETEQHKLLAICEWFYNNEGKREEEHNCSSCITSCYTANPEPTEDELNKCHELLPPRFKTCDSSKTKLGRLLELQRYREEALKIYRKFYLQVLSLKEQQRLHQIWILVYLINEMKKGLPKPDLKLIVHPIIQCITPGKSTTRSDEEGEEDIDTGSLMADFEAFRDINVDIAKQKREAPEDASQHRTLIKNITKKLWNLCMCYLNAIMGNKDSAAIVKDFLKEYEGAMPIALARMAYKCKSKSPGNEA